MMRLETSPLRQCLAAELRREHPRPTLYWLGQAGFAIAFGPTRLFIDPYLSDHLAQKYRDRGPSHERMMAPPVAAGDLDRIDWVLCTHRHSDHMDPGFLPEAAERFADLSFLVPAAEREHALALGIPEARLSTIDAGEHRAFGAFTVEALPAAHEQRERDDAGCERYLGYVVTIGGVRIYHSGDTVVFAELKELLAPMRPDVALLPVNGRGNGVAGNMTLDEAVALCRDCGMANLVPHHFGMFAFNTIESEAIDRTAAATDEPRIVRPTPDTRIELQAA